MQVLENLVAGAEEVTRSKGRLELEVMAPVVDFFVEHQTSEIVQAYLRHCASLRPIIPGTVQCSIWLLTLDGWTSLRVAKWLLELKAAGCGDNALRSLREKLLDDDDAYTLIMPPLDDEAGYSSHHSLHQLTRMLDRRTRCAVYVHLPRIMKEASGGAGDRALLHRVQRLEKLQGLDAGVEAPNLLERLERLERRAGLLNEDFGGVD